MAFNHNPRRDSWPPTILHVSDERYDAAAVDANPFQYFLTAPTPNDFDEMYEDFGAGIESDCSKPQVREVSPSSLQRAEEEKKEKHPILPVTLRDLAASVGFRSPSPPRKSSSKPTDTSALKAPILTYTPSRGRATVRLSPVTRQARGRGQTRSLPTYNRRPHSWRLPSPDVWSIAEEEEEKAEGDDSASNISELDLTDPRELSPLRTPDLEKDVPSPKPKKRVRWAL